jgi:hypothetical protein
MLRNQRQLANCGVNLYYNLESSYQTVYFIIVNSFVFKDGDSFGTILAATKQLLPKMSPRQKCTGICFHRKSDMLQSNILHLVASLLGLGT